MCQLPSPNPQILKQSSHQLDISTKVVIMLAAVGQMTSGAVIRDNLQAAKSLISRAAQAGAQAIFLPEATDFIAPADQVSQLTNSADNSQFVEGIRDASRINKVTVSVGIHEPSSEEKRCFNTQLLIDPKGDIIQRYRKLHLFDVDIQGGLTILESNTTIPGNQICSPVATSIGKIGLLTCYDLRFPEPSLSLRRQGADILTFPSAFTLRTGAAHWEPLLRARAIETQSYVIASAQVGPHPGTKRVSYGHAMIVDPWGSVIAQCGDVQPYQPTFSLADINLDALQAIRQEMPLWSQRRAQAYSIP